MKWKIKIQIIIVQLLHWILLDKWEMCGRKQKLKFIFQFDRIAIWCRRHTRKPKCGHRVRMSFDEWLTCIWGATVWCSELKPDRVCPIPTEKLCRSDCPAPCTGSRNPGQIEWTKFRSLCTRSDAISMWTNHRVWWCCCHWIGLVSSRQLNFRTTIKWDQKINKNSFRGAASRSHSLWTERNRPAIWRSQHSFGECRASNSLGNVHSLCWMGVHFSEHWMCCSSRWLRWWALCPDATISTSDPCRTTLYDCRAYRSQHSVLHRDALRRRRISRRTHPTLCSTIATNDLCLPTARGAVSSGWISAR